MNENIKKSRLLFEIARKQTSMAPTDVVAKNNAISSAKLVAARGDFDYNRKMAEVEIGNEMLNGKNLTDSVQSVAQYHINEYGEIERESLSL